MRVEGLVFVNFVRVVDGSEEEVEVSFGFLAVGVEVGEVERDTNEST